MYASLETASSSKTASAPPPFPAEICGEDAESMHARYYSPRFGRFLSVDPRGRYTAARSTQVWNRYSYSLNNPITYIDPDGREVRVASNLNSAVLRGLKGSDEFRRIFRFAETSDRIVVDVRLEARGPLLGTVARSSMTPAFSSNNEISLTGTVFIPAAKGQRAVLIGHELSHFTETIEKNTLPADIPGATQNAGGVETPAAKAATITIRQEIRDSEKLERQKRRERKRKEKQQQDEPP